MSVCLHGLGALCIFLGSVIGLQQFLLRTSTSFLQLLQDCVQQVGERVARIQPVFHERTKSCDGVPNVGSAFGISGSAESDVL